MFLDLDPDPEIAPERRTETTSDGFVFDVATGEIVGRVDIKAGWRAETAEDVEWALELRSKIESDLAAIRIRKAALLKNLTAMERDIERKLAWWTWRFQPDVIAFARKSLEGVKSKTARFAFGKVAFRTTQGTNKIVDDVAAVAFVEALRPELVKVERSVTVKDVLKVAAEHGESRPNLAHFLFSTAPSESVTIETGVEG